MKILKKIGKITLSILRAVAIVVAVSVLINGIGGLLTKRYEKKQADYRKNNTTSVDNINESNKTTIDQMTVVNDNSDNLESSLQAIEALNKAELQKKYTYVAGPIVRNNKKYWVVRQRGMDGDGWVDYQTLKEVIPCGRYDYIGNEFIFEGKSYVNVSIPFDDKYAYGILSLDTLTEVVPCKVYRDVDVNYEEQSIECLKEDRETIDIYQMNDNTKILTKK